MIKLNNELLEITKFPNGESHINGKQIQDTLSFFSQENSILFKYESDEDLIQLMFVKRYLDDLGANKTNLVVSYMPYSRMDRVEGTSVFTLKYVSEFINALNFTHVFIHEAHSDVAPALVNRSVALETSKQLLDEVITKTGFDVENDYLFFPDGGAQKRYSKLGDYKELVGFKKRNFETGRIESLDVIGTLEEGRKIIILDDLSSYGGTFMMSAEKLKEIGAGDIYLAVVHAEESIFIGKIPESDLITKVYTTDSIINESTNDKIEIALSVGWKEETVEEPELDSTQLENIII